jgi:hypothetical protein
MNTMFHSSTSAEHIYTHFKLGTEEVFLLKLKGPANQVLAIFLLNIVD